MRGLISDLQSAGKLLSWGDRGVGRQVWWCCASFLRVVCFACRHFYLRAVSDLRFACVGVGV